MKVVFLLGDTLGDGDNVGTCVGAIVIGANDGAGVIGANVGIGVTGADDGSVVPRGSFPEM
jgi:hypothetical protein